MVSLGLLFVAAFVLSGCSLPGLSDRTARYAIPSLTNQDLLWRVRARLSVARLSADVAREGDTLLVRATGDRIDAVVTVLALPSGLALHELPARCAATQSACEGAPRAEDTGYEGAAPHGEKHVALRLPKGLVRTLAVREVAQVVSAKELVVTRAGPRVTLVAKPGTNAAALLSTQETVVLTSGSRALYIGKPNGRTLALELGDGLEAYERARAIQELLASPELPSLGVPTVTGAPQNLELAAFSLGLPVLLSLVYVFFVRRFDRAHPEPLGLVAITFVLGAASTALAGLIEWGCVLASPWTTPQLLTFGGQWKALPLSVLGFALLVGVPEEGAKLLATIYATRRREFDEPVDGIVYGVVSALGFAAAENVVYFASGRLAAPLIVGRAFTALPVHVFLSGLWGYALGARLVRPKQRVWPWFLLSALLHGGYDAAMSTESGFGLGLLVVLGLAIGFVAVLRASLRHGPVSEATVRAAGLARKLHAFGRGPAFPVLAVLLPVLAAALLGVSAAWESSGATATSPYTWPMVLLVVGIGAILWGITSTLPLDAVVDAHGVTFAGAVRAFSEVDATIVHGEYLEVVSPRGDIEIGPGTREELDALASEIEAGRTTMGSSARPAPPA